MERERELQRKRAHLVKTSHDKLERLRLIYINNMGYDSMELRYAVDLLSLNNIDRLHTKTDLLLANAKLTEFTARSKRLAVEYSSLAGNFGNITAAETMIALNQAHREENIMGAIIDALESAIEPVECVQK